MRKILAGLVLSGALLAVAVPVVNAHECYIVNRSDAGARGAGHSANWGKPPSRTPSASSTASVGGPALAARAVPRGGRMSRRPGPRGARLGPSGGPDDRRGLVDKNLAHGKGLDHPADVYGGQIVGIYFGVAGL